VVTPLSGPDDARTRIRRLPEKQVDDRAVLDAILDAGRVAHVVVTDSAGAAASGEQPQPYVLPVGYGHQGDRILIHGSTASRLFRGLASGAPTCLTVTLEDGLVLARSAFESSMHYRSAMVLGRCSPLDGDEKLAGLERITEHLMPGRWTELRAPTRKELAATLVLELPLTDWSVKVSEAPPDDPADDLDAPVWAGVLPLRRSWGSPLPAPDLRGHPAEPAYLGTWRA
jgi:uncharacterized protein